MSGRKTGVDIWLHSFLPSAPHRREWWTSRNSCFTTTEKAPSLHRIGGWVGPGPVQTFWIKKEISTLTETKHQAVQHLTQSLHDHITHFHTHNNSSSNYHQWKILLQKYGKTLDNVTEEAKWQYYNKQIMSSNKIKVVSNKVQINWHFTQ